MPDLDVPADVQRFLHENLESLEQLEVLLMLSRRPHDARSSIEVAEELRIRDSLADDALRLLCKRGLLVVAGSAGNELFRYDPVSTTLAYSVERLAETYSDQRVAILKFMTASAIQRLRAGALGMFSNAFVFGRRGKPRG
jgi:hypothetical protein